MKKKKNKEEKWSDKHLIIDIEGFSKKQKQELKDKIMQKALSLNIKKSVLESSFNKVAQRIERNSNDKSIS